MEELLVSGGDSTEGEGTDSGWITVFAAVVAASITVHLARRIWWRQPCIHLAFSATSTRGSGVLVWHRYKRVHHYSIDWASVGLQFSSQSGQHGPDLVNAFLALKFFTGLVHSVERGDRGRADPLDKVIVKFDGNRLKHTIAEATFWEQIQRLRNDFNKAEWRSVSPEEDLPLQAAVTLAGGRATQPGILYPGYEHVNCNGEVLLITRNNLHSIPSKYHPPPPPTRLPPTRPPPTRTAPARPAAEFTFGDIFAGIGGVVAAGLAIGGAAYGISQLLSHSEDESRRRRTATQANVSFLDSVHELRHEVGSFLSLAQPQAAISYTSTPPPNLVLAVDARPTQGGGLLICYASKTIYHYSLDWTAYLQFPPQPDKFESTNAFLALTLFCDRIQNLKFVYKDKYAKEVSIKVDNSTFDRRRGLPDKPNEYNLFRHRIERLKDAVGGEWCHMTKDEDDPEFRAADDLSRNKFKSPYPDFQHYNCDKRALETLEQNLEVIPEAFHAKAK